MRAIAILAAAAALQASAAQAERVRYDCEYTFECNDVERCTETSWREAFLHDADAGASYTLDPMTGKWTRINHAHGTLTRSFISLGESGLRWVATINEVGHVIRSSHKTSPTLRTFDPSQQAGMCTMTTE